MILFNEKPKIKYDIDEATKEEILNNGYAIPQDDLEIQDNNSAVLHFMNVEEHIDGNGLSILWLINGEGTFFIQDKSLQEHSLKKGDVLVFNDNIEHRFYSNMLCTAVNFTIEDIGLDIEKIKEIVQNYNQNNQNIFESDAINNDEKLSARKISKKR